MITLAENPNKLMAIRWGRVFLASVFAEIAYFSIIWAYAILEWFVPGRTETEMYEFDKRIGAYIFAFIGSILVLTLSFLVARTIESNFILNGMMVGLLFSLFGIGLGFPDKVKEQIVIRCLVNLASGCTGAAIAQIRYRCRSRGNTDA